MLSFPPKAAIQGVPVTRLKSLLGTIERTGDPRAAIELHSASPSRCDNAIALHVAARLNMLDPETWGLTDLGFAILGSSSTRRMMRANAAELLAWFLERVEHYNRRDERLTDIAEVWLFGSYLKGAPEVGDVDIALRQTARKDTGGRRKSDIANAAFQALFPGAAPTDWLKQRERVFGHLLFGRSRPAKLAVHNDTATLIELAEPCALIYTREIGAIASPVTCAKHPESTARAETIRERTGLPGADELISATIPLEPMSALWTSEMSPRWQGPTTRSFEHHVAVGHINQMRHGRASGRSHSLEFATSSTNALLPSRPLPDDLDGCFKVAILSDAGAILLERRFERRADNAVVYHFRATAIDSGPAKPSKVKLAAEAAIGELLGYCLAMIAAGDFALLQTTLGMSAQDIVACFDLPETRGMGGHFRNYLYRLVQSKI